MRDLKGGISLRDAGDQAGIRRRPAFPGMSAIAGCCAPYATGLAIAVIGGVMGGPTDDGNEEGTPGTVEGCNLPRCRGLPASRWQAQAAFERPSLNRLDDGEGCALDAQAAGIPKSAGARVWNKPISAPSSPEYQKTV
ncbi:MAG: hypothetical protein DLM68_01215 [Hyphomicrobiales bacterium]|nr:MAG: hypothetical protein DLM68_01215 [Hyphomicrobiales bacterium]